MSRIQDPVPDAWERKFREDLAADTAFEARLLLKEIGIVTIIVGLVLLWGAFL